MERRGEGPGDGSYESPEAEGGINLLAATWRHKWIAILLTVVGGGLGYLYFLQCPPVFQSSGQMLIVKKDVSIPVQGLEGSRSTYNDPMPMHTTVLASPTVIARAVEKFNLATLPSLRDSDNPTLKIVGGLGVESKSTGGTLVTLTYRGSESKDCAAIVDALMKTYQEFVGETYQNFSDETIKLITEAKDVLLKQLTEKETAYREFRQQAPLLWRGDQGSNIHEARLSGIEGSRASLIVEMTQTKGRLETLEAAIASGGNREALSLLATNATAAAANAGNGAGRISPRNAFEERWFSLLLDEQSLLEEHGKDHPKILAHKRKMDFIRDHLGGKTATDGLLAGGDFLSIYVESLRQELKWQEVKMASLNSLFEEERDAAKSLNVYQVQDEGFRSEISRVQLLFGAVIKRLDEINLVKDYGGIKTQIVSSPYPGLQIAPQLSKMAGMGCFLGALVGLALGWLTEFLDKRFRTPQEIRRALDLPILGHIPMISPREKKGTAVGADTPLAALSPVLCVAHHPKGHQAEAYRGIRTALYFQAETQGCRVIQVTSPNPEDGKTTTAINLSLSIAESGKRVLLIDADFRRPRVHKHLGLENKVGLFTVMSGETEIQDAIQTPPVQNLTVLTSGGRPNNPAELLTSPRFKELLDVVREQYDFVIVDTPPVLAVTDPSVVAPRVDGVVLVMRLTKAARTNSRHATETLEELGAKILGVVVNGLTRGSAGAYGGYGNYRYGYGRGYRYGYGYSYGEGYGESESDQGADNELDSNGNGNGHASHPPLEQLEQRVLDREP